MSLGLTQRFQRAAPWAALAGMTGIMAHSVATAPSEVDRQQKQDDFVQAIDARCGERAKAYAGAAAEYKRACVSVRLSNTGGAYGALERKSQKEVDSMYAEGKGAFVDVVKAGL